MLNLSIVIALVAGIGFGALITSRSRHGWRRMPSASTLRTQLVRRLMNDAGAAERLIDLERRRRPQGSEAEHIRAALARLERDNS